LCLLWASLAIVLPTMHVVAIRFLDSPPPIDLDRFYPSLSEIFSAFVTPGLVLLVSWIMDVGLYQKEHADELERDADLTI
jgi:hypothetical protein